MVWVTESKAPDDLRIYAIGDVHGCLDMLRELHDAIEQDLSQHPADDWTVVHVGDYVDRGPDSRGVIDYLSGLAAKDDRMVFLLGNHDLMFSRSVKGDRQMLRTWMTNGGEETLQSYGLRVDTFIERLSQNSPMDDVFPPEHIAFLENLDHAAHMGDFFFVHAGVDPERGLDAQELDDMLWIRDRFIRDGREYEAVIVHGHTPTRRVDVKANRVGIDTGAVYGGDLTCLVLDGARKARIGPTGRLPLL
ncbi:MAG: metallophosphoesterase family protein [Pseudomonadota bacterium]